MFQFTPLREGRPETPAGYKNRSGFNSRPCVRGDHDSFGTHAAESEHLACALRETFVQMYPEHDVLKELRDTIYHRLPEDLKEELPELPPTGRLNLAEVINSPYFFA